MSAAPAGYCIVGIGGHARTKLIPAIAANGQELRGLVSRQHASALPAAPVFPAIDEAIKALPADTTFLIASPPGLHFGHAMTALAAGRDVIVEKPAFVSAAQAQATAEAAARSGAVLIEAFMQRHTRLFGWLREDWPAMRADLAAIRIAFIVPSLPAKTFRQSTEVEASVLYDIGCYAISLIADLDLPLHGMAIAGLERPNGRDELLHIAGDADGIAIDIRVGVDATYENSVTLRRGDGSSVCYAPFFYGRAGERRVTAIDPDGRRKERTIIEGNAFETMLAVPRAEWAGGQQARLRDIIAVTTCLERLSEELPIVGRGT